MSLEKTMTFAKTLTLETTQSIAKTIAQVPVALFLSVSEWNQLLTNMVAGKLLLIVDNTEAKGGLCR